MVVGASSVVVAAFSIRLNWVNFFETLWHGMDGVCECVWMCNATTCKLSFESLDENHKVIGQWSKMRGKENKREMMPSCISAHACAHCDEVSFCLTKLTETKKSGQKKMDDDANQHSNTIKCKCTWPTRKCIFSKSNDDDEWHTHTHAHNSKIEIGHLKH